MMLLLLLFSALWPAGEAVVTLDGNIRRLAVTRDSVFVATERSLYQLGADLGQKQRVSLDGIQNGEKFHRVPHGGNESLAVNVLLPFASRGRLFVCGAWGNGCGHCDVLSLQDVSNVLYSESVILGPVSRNRSESVAFLVTEIRGRKEEIFILTATEKSREAQSSSCGMVPTGVVHLFNTEDSTDSNQGGILSWSAEKTLDRRDKNHEVGFVDGFQLESVIYLFSNVRVGDEVVVRVLWLQAKHDTRSRKINTLKSLTGAALSSTGQLVASSVIPDSRPLTWSGVFNVDGSRANTELLLFDVSPEHSNKKNDNDPHFVVSKSDTEQLPTLNPLKSLLRQSHMTSVLARTHLDWLLFFIGTSDGQVIKLVVDKNYHSACPKVLYKASDDRAVFQKLHVSEDDPKHVYVAITNQIMMIPVSRCSNHKTLWECWSAQDPQCVWCDTSQSCSFRSDCRNSNWTSISKDLQQEKMVSFRTESTSGQVVVTVQLHVSVGPNRTHNFACEFSVECRAGLPPTFPQCICVLNSELPAQGLIVKMQLWETYLSQTLNVRNCSVIVGPASPNLCRECFAAGCAWSSGRCSWASEAKANETICQEIDSNMNFLKPEISSVDPNVVSFYGKNQALLTGHNLGHVTRIRIHGALHCKPLELPVWNVTDTSLTFHIPNTGKKGEVQVCAVLPDDSCHGNASITYRSLPSCDDVRPKYTWLSGGRIVTLVGSYMNFVDAVFHNHSLATLPSILTHNAQNLTYISPAAESPVPSIVFLKVANQTLNCSKALTYVPDPVFTSYIPIRTGDDVSITIQKKSDDLDLRLEELSVSAIRNGRALPCVMVKMESDNETDFYTCEIRDTASTDFQKLQIMFGGNIVELTPPSSYLLLILLVLLLIPCILIVVLCVFKKKQSQLTTRMNSLMENLEMDIRNDIRQGFIDLQIENADLLENVTTIPFLDYKHFAGKTFFPESEHLMKSCIKDIGQDGVIVQLDESCQTLSRLIRDQVFLTTMVHALEEQKNFSIKDKCALASLLTVALHSDLTYLTEVMEVLLKDLMHQSRQSQPKLLLRRTESIVEKLLTNWMSICLYGFLRETVGQPLYLLVSALSQQISKGPVDYVTEKALYTLSEDWLLWQAQDFHTLKLKVQFSAFTDGELSEPLEVAVLSCDTVDQVKDKILTAFRNKFGFPYSAPARELAIDFVRGTACLRLEEVDLSSERLGDVTMLNTMKHYNIPDGATMKAVSRKSHAPLSSQGSVKDDQDFSGKYFHLIDPDIVEDLKNPERKKLKLKEVHLTKLLSTKVAVHSFVERLFRCIWGLQMNKAPLSIKYFFDFLDAQAEDMKITDPDVLHIWKTNSLPLRFWVNILKNPQFVFDLDKSPHLDGCLSVIAQAFMDSFSLSDTQLGKHTPTNKLLYGKEIPKYKQEVKFYYKQIQDQPPVADAEFTDFLHNESKKHENEFNEAAALKEIYKFIQKYFTEIQKKLEQDGAPSELQEQLHHVKKSFDGLKSCSWN